jgi:hypothetical protein
MSGNQTRKEVTGPGHAATTVHPVPTVPATGPDADLGMATPRGEASSSATSASGRTARPSRLPHSVGRPDTATRPDPGSDRCSGGPESRA